MQVSEHTALDRQMTNFDTIIFNNEQGVATITFNRPDSLNAFNDQMISETMNALKIAARDGSIRCIVVTGTGRAFSSGQDLKEFQNRDESITVGHHLRHGYNKLVGRMVTLEKPILAAVNGIAAGAGCGIALAADLRVAADKASFMQAFSRVGLIPDSGSTWSLPMLIGYSRAYEMAITADRIPAEKALEWGMVNRVVPAAQLMEIARAWAFKLAKGPTLAFGLTKRAMRKAMLIDIESAMEYEALLQDHVSHSHDTNEGIQAFIEKREPQFKGE